jgi:hypothetical protein
MKMKVINMLKTFMIYVITDKSGEYKFSVKGHEISATFTDKPNKEILPRLKEILLGEANLSTSKEAAETEPEDESLHTDAKINFPSL